MVYTTMWTNLITIEIKKEQKGPESLFKEIMDQNFPNLGNKMNIQIEETQSTSLG